MRVFFFSLLLGLSLLANMGCSYHYHRGQQLQSEGRYESANIEFSRARIDKPWDEEIRQAYQKTAQLTVADIEKRYKRYIVEKRLKRAFPLLQRALDLEPQHSFFLDQKKKWLKVLIAGRFEFEILSLLRTVKIAEEVRFSALFNTPTPDQKLWIDISGVDGSFIIEDYIYDPPQEFLFLYSLNGVGIRTKDTSFTLPQTQQQQQQFERSNEGVVSFSKLIDFGTPVLSAISGKLEESSGDLLGVKDNYPKSELQANTGDEWSPNPSITYSIRLEGKRALMSTAAEGSEFMPQMIYLNRADQRVLIDFGLLRVSQRKRLQSWSIKRLFEAERTHINTIADNFIWHPYSYYRQGAYPIIHNKTSPSS